MANNNSPFGFSVIGRVPGAPAADFARTKRLISNSNTHQIFKGDVAKDLGTGYVDVAAAGLTQILGVFDQFEYVSVSLQRVVWSNYYPGADAAGDVSAWIITDPYALFNVQATLGPATPAMIGSNCDLSAATAGNTLTQTSGMTLDTSTSATTATLPFRVWNLTSSQYPASDVGAINGIDDTTAYNQVLVTFNSQALKTLTGI